MQEMGRCDGSLYAWSNEVGSVDEIGDEFSMILL